MVAEDVKGVVGRFWEEVYNQGNISAMDEIFASDFKVHDLAYGEEHGLEDLKGILSSIHADLPGTQVIIEDQVSAEGNNVVTRFTVHIPTQESADASEESTGERSGFNGISISQVFGGRITESWFMWEALRAQQEGQPPDVPWRWPPWKW